MMEVTKKRPEFSKVLQNVEYIEKHLHVAVFVLFSTLILVQLLHYSNVLQGFLNPVYSMESKFFSSVSNEFYPKTLVVTGDSPEDEKVVIRKNGRPIGQVFDKNKLYIYLFRGDVLEIDASKTKGEYRIVFECLDNSQLPDMIPESIEISSKLYRFPAFY